MATGASKARREARKQETKAYYDALKKLERANAVKRIDTRSASKLDDNLGGDVSYGAKRLAMKADKIGKQINNDPSLNQGIEAFNKRFDEMKRQMAGETIQKYEVVQDRDPSTGLAGIAVGSSLVGQTAIGKYDSNEEAMKANPNPSAPKQTGILGFGMQSQSLPFGQKPKPTYSVQEANLTPITGGYRELTATKGAYKDLEQLSKNVSANASAKMTKEYEVIGNQLKAKLKRDASSLASAKPIGLLNSELASAAPKQEVIR
jgi:hypothetical protein